MKTILRVAILFVGLLLVPGGYGQDPTPSPTPATTEAVATNPQGPNESAAKTATASPAPSPEPDFWHREEMTGDWGGARGRLKEKGVEMEFKLTQFGQGIASGGTGRNSVYNGKLQTDFKLDLGKLAGWKYWSAEIQTETRFGGPVLAGPAASIRSTPRRSFPRRRHGLSPLARSTFTRLIPNDLSKGDMFAVSFGRYNLVELLDEDFFAGGGNERFFNIAPIGPLTVLREVPLITNAANFIYIKGGEPRFTFSVLDPNDYSLEPGLDKLFKDGVTFSPAVNFPVKYFGKSAKHTIGGAVTTKKFTPFDSIKQIIIPGPPRNPVEPKPGSWSISYTFRQYIVERGRRDGWGFFSQVSFANKDTSPITKFVNVGLGGNGLFKSRSQDEFGVSYAYTGLSRVLNDNIDLLTIGNRRPQPEHQFETFYNFHLTPWLRLTGDLQIIRGVRPAVKTAVVPGVRLEMIF
jgi:porin